MTNNLMFDEKHYVVDARHIVYDHYSDRNEHPPLAKLLISSGIMVFGDNPFGWRIMAILVGELAIVSFYLICRSLELSRRGASLATLVFATETLTFAMAGIAMLDIFMVAFMMLGFALYLRGNYPLSALAIVLSTLCKLTGIFGLLAIGLHWLIKRRNKPMKYVVPLGISGAGFSLVMFIFDPNLVQNVLNSFTQMKSLTFEATQQVFASHPWQWVVSLEGMVFNTASPHYVAMLTLTVWALCIPIMLWMLYYAVKKRDDLAIFGLSWFAAVYLIWFPIDILTGRVMFLFYFLPAVGAIVLGIGKWLDNMLKQKDRDARIVSAVFVAVFLVAHVVLFALTVPPFNEIVGLF